MIEFVFVNEKVSSRHTLDFITNLFQKKNINIQRFDMGKSAI